MLRWEGGGDGACMLERSLEELVDRVNRQGHVENGVVDPGTITSDAGAERARYPEAMFVAIRTSIYLQAAQHPPPPSLAHPMTRSREGERERTQTEQARAQATKLKLVYNRQPKIESVCAANISL